MQSVPTKSFSATESRATLSLASLFALRMLGLFMIVPIFTLYAQHLQHVTPLLMGIALGCYGLTQAVLQIPFGMWSDRVGRKRIIALGLILFGLGSIIAALSHSIWGVIIGRSLQGAGAVGSTTLALLADLTRDEKRTKAMATVGVTIGMSFSLAMFLGPVLNSWISVSGIFWLTALFALIGLVILKMWVPRPEHLTVNPNVETVPANLPMVLRNPQLLRLDLGILLIHAILTATFVVLPIGLQNTAGLVEKQQWWIYLPTLLLGFATAIPMIIIAEKKRLLKQVFLTAISLIILSELLFYFGQHSILTLAVSLWLFFSAFTLLEAILPSAISKAAPKDKRGTAIGVFSSCQFFGIFLGGTLGGWLYGHFNVSGVLIACAAVAVLWLLLVMSSRYNDGVSTNRI